MFQQEESSYEVNRDIGPQRLLQSILKSGYDIDQIGEKHLLGEKSKFKVSLDALQEDYRPQGEVSCRKVEKNEIERYLRQSLGTQGCSQSLYISGVPGIGKTLCVKEVVNKLHKEFSETMKPIYTNALCLTKPIQIFRTIYYQLTGSIHNPNTAMYKLNELFEKGVDNQPLQNNRYGRQFRQENQNKKQRNKFLRMKKVLILDQLDYLKTKEEEVLYNIFQWTQKRKSHLIIISISNTVDFPELLSPKVNSRIGNRRVFFKPYESYQIENILNQRIKHLDVFDQEAISYTCKKIAQCSSDIRKCLYVLRESILEFIVQEKAHKKGQLKDQDLKNKKIGVDILNRIQERIYTDHFSTTFHEFPPCYKIILYFLAKHFKSQNTACTIRKLQAMCKSWTRRQNQLLSTLCDLKELGIITITYGKVQKQRKVYGDFIDMKQLSQQHIRLTGNYSNIIHALQKEDLDSFSKQNFKMDLNI